MMLITVSARYIKMDLKECVHLLLFFSVILRILFTPTVVISMRIDFKECVVYVLDDEFRVSKQKKFHSQSSLSSTYQSPDNFLRLQYTFMHSDCYIKKHMRACKIQSEAPKKIQFNAFNASLYDEILCEF